jgi:hypothetical protein
MMPTTADGNAPALTAESINADKRAKVLAGFVVVADAVVELPEDRFITGFADDFADDVTDDVADDVTDDVAFGFAVCCASTVGGKNNPTLATKLATRITAERQLYRAVAGVFPKQSTTIFFAKWIAAKWIAAK